MCYGASFGSSTHTGIICIVKEGQSLLLNKKLLLLLLVIGLVGVMAVYAHDDDPPPEGEPDVHVEDYEFDEPLTYYEHIKPIFDINCMGCHGEGQIAGSSIALSDPDTVQRNAGYITDTVAIGYMPPWMPSRENVPLQNARLLTEREIATVIAWYEGGAAMGDPADAVTVESDFQLPEIRQDMAFTIPDGGYTPAADNEDDYRCFLFDPQIEAEQFITGYVFEPDEMAMVHHGIVYLLPASARNRANQRDAVDEGSGWSCYNTTGLPDEEMLGTWAPGTFPVAFPERTGYRIQPGDFFVLQVHYNTRQVRVPDETGFSVELEDGDADIRPLMTVELTAPVEIPCPEGVEGPQCERDNAIAYAAERYGQEFAGRPDYLLRQCNQSLLDYANLDPANAESRCETTVFFSVEVVGVFGHMHELGKRFRLELNPDSEDNVVLLDIPRWDFHWQDRYQFVEPIRTRIGDVLRMTCVWDNTLSSDPRYVVWGEGTEDEMCFGTVMILEP